MRGRKPPLIVKLMVVAVIGLMGLVLAELAIRWKLPNLPYGPMVTHRDPYYGYWLRPDLDRVVRTSTGYQYHQKTNSIGHRAPPYIDAPNGHVICLGDSYTMGDTVDFGKEFAAVVRDSLRPRGFEVVNFGKAGNGQGRWLKFLRRDAKDYTPRLVVMQLCENDFGDNEIDWLYRLREDGSLEELTVRTAGTVDRIRDAVEAIPGVSYSRLYQFIKQRVRAATGAQGFEHPDQKEKSPEEIARENALALALLRACLEECRVLGVPVIWMQVGLDDDRLAAVRSEFDAFAAIELDVPSIKDRPDLYQDKDPHWNDAGHRFVGEGILRLIDERGLLAPRE